MSCGLPHETDCHDVLNEVYLYLDGEIDADRKRLIRDHLDECSPCLREFGIEQEVKVLVARRCGGDRAPETLGQISVDFFGSGTRAGSIVFAPVTGSMAAMTFCVPASIENR